MVAFLNTSNAYAQIEQIIDKATTEVFLISPYVRFPKPLLERLKYKDGQGIKTIVVCREKDSNQDLGAQVRSDLKQLKNLELRFDDDLHAKCFFNQESMVITSLNLLESSERKNREMGVRLSLKEDSHVFKEALNEAKYIVTIAKKDSTIRSIRSEFVKEAKKVIDTPKEERSRKVQIPNRAKNKGYCIRCGERITYDVDTPYCPNCYRVWKKYKDPDYEEEYCHWCGAPNKPTSLRKPLCNSCYGKSRQ